MAVSACASSSSCNVRVIGKNVRVRGNRVRSLADSASLIFCWASSFWTLGLSLGLWLRLELGLGLGLGTRARASGGARAGASARGGQIVDEEADVAHRTYRFD